MGVANKDRSATVFCGLLLTFIAQSRFIYT